MRAAAMLVLLCVLAVPADAAEPGFRNGVAAGELTASSAILWTRAAVPGRVRLEVDGDGTTTVRGTRMWDVITGPAATGTFSDSLERLVGAPGGAALLGAGLLKPEPPTGLGLRCAALGTLSYAQVTVTARTLTVAPRDGVEHPVREATGRACAPLVLRAR